MNNYKLYQLLHFFVSRHGYMLISLPNVRNDEVWLINAKHNIYPIIRLTTSSIQQVVFERYRIGAIIDLIKKRVFISQGKFLDIHLTKEQVGENEIFDSICLDSNYYSGLDLSFYYPNLKNVIHEVADARSEISNIVKDINHNLLNAARQKKYLKWRNLNATKIIFLVCVLVFVIQSLLIFKGYNQNSAAILLGGNYKALTLGGKEYWRLLTAGFVHGSLPHLLLNMLALFNLGNYYEQQLGRRKYLFVLLGGIIFASSISSIMNVNILTVGISGGLYSLFALTIMTLINKKMLDGNLFGSLFLAIIINFMPGVDIYGHLGGFIFGVLAYYCLATNINKKIALLSMLVVFLGVSYRFYTSRPIEPLYLGTDNEIIATYRRLGLKSYADFVEKNLQEMVLETYKYWGENNE